LDKRREWVAVALVLGSPSAAWAITASIEGNTAFAVPEGGIPPSPVPIPTHVSSHPCEPYDLRRDHGAPYEHVPVLDQSKYSYCSTFSVAGFVDGWIQQHLPNPPRPGSEAHDRLRHHVTSPFVNHARLAAARGITRMERESPSEVVRSPENLVDQLRTSGSCNHLAVFGASRGGTRRDGEILDALNRSWQEFDTFITDRERVGRMIDNDVSFEQILYRGLAPAARNLHCALLASGVSEADIPGSLVRNTNPALMRLIFGDRGVNSRVELINNYFNQSCQGDQISLSNLPTVDSKWFDAAEATQVVSHLHALMDRPAKEPILVSFCGRVLERGRPFKAYVDSNKCENPANPRPGDPVLAEGSVGRHGGVIIGRKRNPDGSCKVLVRNSWGRSCGGYAYAGWECEQGNVWVDIRDLAENTYNVRNFKQGER
jgi:hypothetical protein